VNYDLNILGNPDLPVPPLAVDGSLCSGIQALVQQVLVLLLTDPNDPASLGFGTAFGEYIRSSASNRSESETQNILNIALADLTEQFRQLPLPPDRSLKRVQGTVSSEAAGLVLDLEITSEAEGPVSVTYPITVI